jgi:hypothetical protein
MYSEPVNNRTCDFTAGAVGARAVEGRCHVFLIQQVLCMQAQRHLANVVGNSGIHQGYIRYFQGRIIRVECRAKTLADVISRPRELASPFCSLAKLVGLVVR